MYRTSIVLLTCLVTFAVSARAADFIVTNTNATGPGSLNAAIVAANAAPGADRIIFAIPGAGLHKIDVSQTALPDITDSVTIDGYTQPGSKPNTAAMGSNAVLQIQVDGMAAGFQQEFRGFAVMAANCTLRGLMITGFSGSPNSYGIKVQGTGCLMEGNFIGTDGTATAALGNTTGIHLLRSGATVGGNTPAARNVIGGNEYGIQFYQDIVNNKPLPLIDLKISGNQIGTNPQEAGAGNGKVEGAPNQFEGIMGYASSKGGAVIGGTTPEEGNLISGSNIGIDVYENCLIEGNLIGLQPDRATPVVNQDYGVEIDGVDNVIGGLAEGAGNQIAFNQLGIVLPLNPKDDQPEAFQNTFLSNQIYANSKIGIDLDREGPTHNDYGDADAGSNNLQNFPVIASVQQSSSGTVISGGLNSKPSMPFTVQVFENLAGSSGQNLLGTQQVTTDASGSVLFQIDSPNVTSSDSTFTATATDASGNTSEFSRQTGPVQLANISTRGFVGTGENILIGGFIVRDQQPKKLGIRALGPSVNVPDQLADPYLEIYDGNGKLLAKNDDWRTGQQQELIDAGIAPKSDVESALIISLPSGAYTAQVTGVTGHTGNAIVEIYDLDPFSATSGRLLNISTRGFVGTGNDVLIGGFIARGDVAEKLIIRAIGPDLAARGVQAPLQDPTLELRDSSGNLVAANDNWNNGEVPAQSQPGDPRDSVIVTPLAPGAYTAIVRGATGGSGVALVEFYDVKN